MVSIPMTFEDREAETKTQCPDCKGSGKLDIVKIQPGVYRFTTCYECKGEGMISASQLVKKRSGVYAK